MIKVTTPATDIPPDSPYHYRPIEDRTGFKMSPRAMLDLRPSRVTWFVDAVFTDCVHSNVETWVQSVFAKADPQAPDVQETFRVVTEELAAYLEAFNPDHFLGRPMSRLLVEQINHEWSLYDGIGSESNLVTMVSHLLGLECMSPEEAATAHLAWKVRQANTITVVQD